ncbi:MAG TPA: hypothetical protein VF161_07950 [Steroidobacteraceae bacterium]
MLRIGRFLEISVYAPEIRESLEFYESLGFVQAPVGEIWAHPYAVVTDGRLFLGLHGSPLPSPTLSFVLPELQHAMDGLEQAGVVFESFQFGEEAFHQASFLDPAGHSVRLLEARTFSPPPLEAPSESTCGYFSEVGLPAGESAATRAFWEALGFVALEEESTPFPHTPLTSSLLNLGLYRSRAFRQPVLTFEGENMRERLARLRERGLKLTDEMPDSLDGSANAVLIAPEGTRLLLLSASGEG